MTLNISLINLCTGFALINSTPWKCNVLIRGQRPPGWVCTVWFLWWPVGDFWGGWYSGKGRFMTTQLRLCRESVEETETIQTTWNRM